MKSYLSRRAGCFCRQAAGSLNVLDTLAYVVICNHWSATRIYDVLMNQGVSTEDNRGLTSYKQEQQNTRQVANLNASCLDHHDSYGQSDYGNQLVQT
jgi:hypothetical protein